jgi:hypothetical protein
MPGTWYYCCNKYSLRTICGSCWGLNTVLNQETNRCQDRHSGIVSTSWIRIQSILQHFAENLRNSAFVSTSPNMLPLLPKFNIGRDSDVTILPTSLICVYKIIPNLNYIFYLILGLPSGCFQCGFSTKILNVFLVSSTLATCQAYFSIRNSPTLTLLTKWAAHIAKFLVV